MHMNLTDFPKEIFTNILRYLTPEDIHNLYQIPPIRGYLKTIISIHTDDEKIPNVMDLTPRERQLLAKYCHFINIHGSSVNRMKHLIRRKRVNIALFEIYELLYDFESFMNFVYMTNASPKAVTVWHNFHICMNFQNEVISPLYSKHNKKVFGLINKAIGEQGIQKSSLSYLCFKTLKHIYLTHITIDPNSIDIPLLTTATFINCKSADEKSFFKFNKLQHLNYQGPNFGSFGKSLNYSTHLQKLESLTLENVGMVIFDTKRHSYFKSLKSLIIKTDTEFAELNDHVIMDLCDFPKLNQLNIKIFGEVVMEGIEAPLLEKIKIHCTYGNIYMNYVGAHSVKEFILISGGQLPTINNVMFKRFPSMELYFENNKNIENLKAQDVEWLKYASDLKTWESCIDVLRLVDFKYLKTFEMAEPRHFIPQTQVWYNQEIVINAPILESVKLNWRKHSLEMTEFNAPSLKSLTLNVCPILTSLKHPQSQFPQLESLIIRNLNLDHHISLDDDGLVLPSLKQLEIEPSGFEPIKLKNCTFPQLTHFTIQRPRITGEPLDYFQSLDNELSFTAPKLIDLRLEKFHLHKLELLDLPNLINFRITHVDNFKSTVIEKLEYLLLNPYSNRVELLCPHLRHLELTEPFPDANFVYELEDKLGFYIGRNKAIEKRYNDLRFVYSFGVQRWKGCNTVCNN
ncbi:hypothetical protein BN7_268 [Wickerhamomyces ciferrii]|uniref:F-box domain-containing protein n=1 Tax=Wickerhamomyces ciferrii (strain ATCC 14091 / BCRC 22168 / CBS 111 / JCM 3599 / NBRC 0793 / NRRL Y-1031 F-60-10) TaxID=1206466 RepID=K0KH93_WICCF|nr:uncharacterized protein BN7_268 [Wickerhamomyces ciferrii]CCH40734.1 hypothetical protein BN7_268 [Wickerhamomyces ciferrii]